MQHLQGEGKRTGREWGIGWIWEEKRVSEAETSQIHGENSHSTYWTVG